jgi:uncharacterized damage-inducible protein DinB
MAAETSQQQVLEIYLTEARQEFRKLKAQADKAIEQLSPEALLAPLDDEANSVAVLMKHVGGNLRSRWTDFLTSDGDKPDRQRDNEFVITEADTVDSLKASWELGWSRVFESMDALTVDDLSREIVIRLETMPVLRAIFRSMTHTAGHVGQIVLLAKHAKGQEWQCLSIPRGQSVKFNLEMEQRFAGGSVILP